AELLWSNALVPVAAAARGYGIATAAPGSRPGQGTVPGCLAAGTATCSVRNARDDLDLEVEARQPVDADRGPVRIGRLREHFVLDGQDGIELALRIGMEARHVDDVVEPARSEEHTSELQSRENLVCRLLLEKKNAIADTK